MGAIDAAARTVFRDPNVSMAAVYTSAAGVAQNVRVIYTQAVDPVAGSGVPMGVFAQQDTVEVLQSDVPERPRKGAIIALETGETFKLDVSAESSKRGLTWRMVLVNA